MAISSLRKVTILEISPNVHRVAVGPEPFAGTAPPNVYLVVGDGRAAFIDTAHGKDEEVAAHLDLWEAQGRPDVAAIVLTHRHPDHIGGAAQLQEATGGEVVCGVDEKEPIEQSAPGVRVGKTASGGETVDLGGATLEFIEAPGHTLGSLCVYYREEGVLFTGDTVLGSGSVVVSPDHGDMGLYIESLHKLLGYDSRVIAPGHGQIVERPRARLEWLIEHRLKRERQILDLLGQGRSTLEELFEAIYRDLDGRLRDSALSQIRAHLIKLERDGKVSTSGHTDGRYLLA